jgi:hypothetical protein
MSTFLPLPVDRDQRVFTEGPPGNAISTSQLAGILKMYDRSKEQTRQGSYPLLCRTAQLPNAILTFLVKSVRSPYTMSLGG